MKIIFMGTPDFAVSSLNSLIGAGHQVAAVFTRADTPKNRGMKMLPPPVKVAALEHNIKVYQPRSMKDEAVLDIINSISPQLIVVAAFGMILPERVLNAPKYGCINVHASLLPKYRGASPINAAILNGEAESGVTIMQMARGLDTGDMIVKEKTAIGRDETYGQLADRLAGIGAEALLKAIELIKSGKASFEKQDDGASSYAHMIHSSDCQISFAEDAQTVSRKIRAYDPTPGAFGYLGGEKLKLFSASLIENQSENMPGEVQGCSKQGVIINCSKGSLLIGQVQGAGGKKMAADAFFRGHQKLLSEKFS